MPAALEAPPSTRDWTLPAAQAVHALVDLAISRPLTNPGPWVISFTRDGRAHISYRASGAPAGAILICEPGWYRFVWGPTLRNLATHLWETIAADLKQVGVCVQVPPDEQMKSMYWGPMPAGEGANIREWGMPNVAYRAAEARDEYLQGLRQAAPPLAALPWDTRPRRPRAEEAAARLATRTFAAPAAPRPHNPAAPVACSWECGRWGKGFQSATATLYTWNIDHPEHGGRPTHGEQDSLIAAVEGANTLAAGRALTGVSEIGYLSPIVIAPDGSYTQDSYDPFWTRSEFLGADQLRQAEGLRIRFDAAAFAKAGLGLRYVRDIDRWSTRAYDSYPAPRTLTGRRRRVREGD